MSENISMSSLQSLSFMIVLVLSKHYERVLNMNQRVLQLKEISCSVVWWYDTVLTVKFTAFWWYIISLKCILQRTRLKKENSVKVDYNIVHMLNLYMYKYSTNLYIFILMSKSTCVFFFFPVKQNVTCANVRLNQFNQYHCVTLFSDLGETGSYLMGTVFSLSCPPAAQPEPCVV